MRALCLLLIVCGACTKKPAAKAPTPPPPAEMPAPTPEAAPGSQPVERIGDPCEGGEKPN
jgi:hypothetical protein